MPIGDLYDANNVVVGQMAVFTAPADTALPDLDTFNTADPFDEAFFAGDFVPVGATEQGWQLGADKSTQAINIEEQSTQVGMTLQSQSISLQGNLSEDITKTLVLAMNATSVASAADAGSPGFDTITLEDIPIYYAVAGVTTNAEGFGRIIYAPKWTSLGNVSTAFRRAAGQRLYGVNFQTVCKTSDIKIINFTAEATGP
jgi:hypothetical protein